MNAKFQLSPERLLSVLRDKRNKGGSASVIVGYTANYAIYVHEMVGANFKRPGSQAKFLEQPARELKTELTNIIGKTVEKGGTLEQGLMIAGLRLQRASQQVCPVDTGNLRASAFTRKE